MIMDIYIRGKKIRLSPQQAIGKGGEADVYKINKDRAVKVFKQPSHPDYQGSLPEQQAARERLQQHQTKLSQFPTNLPSRAIAPQALATDKRGKTILGYTMPLLTGTTPLLRYGDRQFRTQSGISAQTVANIFKDLHQTVVQIHQVGVIIGDFNDLNVLVLGTAAYLIDADSFQYGQFLCPMFTTRFVDPLLCDPQQQQPILNGTYNRDSDWYAFTVMLMQCLLFVNPYGGVYKPKHKQPKIPHQTRPLKRITVFHAEVRYPKPAIPYHVLPDDLLHYFHRCFHQDVRGQFPRHLLDNLQWSKCLSCGLEHARSNCPQCTQSSPKLTPPAIVTVRGEVKATEIFSTAGVILRVSLVGDRLLWLYWQGGVFQREDDTVILAGELDPNMHFWLSDRSTLVGKQGQVIILNANDFVERIAVDSYDDRPMLQCNQITRYWLQGGQLLREGQLGAEYIGDVLPQQTQFWVGDRFGFGFYRAGNLNVAFVFDAQKQGINDRVKLPRWQGELIDASCIFSRDYCWFTAVVQERGKILHRLYVIQSDGQLIAAATADSTNNSWLTNIWGYCAIGDFLLAPTDEGIVRLEPHNGQIIQTKSFPDTEPFVNSNCQLLAAPKGLYAVSQKQITLLQIKH